VCSVPLRVLIMLSIKIVSFKVFGMTGLGNEPTNFRPWSKCSNHKATVVSLQDQSFKKIHPTPTRKVHGSYGGHNTQVENHWLRESKMLWWSIQALCRESKSLCLTHWRTRTDLSVLFFHSQFYQSECCNIPKHHDDEGGENFSLNSTLIFHWMEIFLSLLWASFYLWSAPLPWQL